MEGEDKVGPLHCLGFRPPDMLLQAFHLDDDPIFFRVPLHLHVLHDRRLERAAAALRLARLVYGCDFPEQAADRSVEAGIGGGAVDGEPFDGLLIARLVVEKEIRRASGSACLSP